MSVEFKKPTYKDMMYIAHNMREADRKEIYAMSMSTPASCLSNALEQSEFISLACKNDIPFAVFGLKLESMLSDTGVPWMLATDQMGFRSKELLQHSKGIVNHMLSITPKLVNYVHAENLQSIRYLKWIGFKIFEKEIMGFKREYFHRFELCATQ